MSAPPILYLQDIHLTFGVTPLLEGAELAVAPGDRLCLVGRNGSGKSTLLKIAAGLIEADKGEVFVQPGIMVAYLEQDPDFSGFETVEDYVLENLMDNEDQQRAFQLMADLNILPKARIAPMSGGERRRVALAKIMAPDPDVLLLDEPTNHLDLPAIEWLETALQGLRAAIVLISHDRRFMSNITKQTLWLDRGQTKIFRRNFSQFENWRDDCLAQEEEAAHKLNKKIEREEHWVRYGVTARRKRNVRRMAELSALRQQKQDRRAPTGQMKATVLEGERSGKLVVKADKINKKYGDKIIVNDFSLQVKRGSRIGLVGANGSGKTTLLNMLTGQLEPDLGNVRLGKNLTPLTLDQQRAGIKKDWTIKDALTDGAGERVSIGEETVHVIGYMKDFLFHPSQMRTPVTVLSGGEQARLFLARGLRQPSNFLILDEPTNDLDLESLDLLQELIANYSGTVLLVSHDRDFLDRTVERVIVSEGDGRWVTYAGGYSDMLTQKKQAPQNETGKSEKNEKQNMSGDAEKAPISPPKKPTTKLSYKHKYALETLPDEMEALTLKISDIQEKLDDSSLFTKNPEEFKALAKELEASQNRLQEAESEWLELEILREEIEGANEGEK
ncbi:MAG: ABC-F family ATP-binding cassette domain-containing protein [Parvibaculales bacterium]